MTIDERNPIYQLRSVSELTEKAGISGAQLAEIYRQQTEHPGASILDLARRYSSPWREIEARCKDHDDDGAA
ncbi:hypothetical protein [Hyphomicrobium sp. MC1]|uniref:hypothetical protein n=1 Tax=Hyphomicrobium sp. (strain MC1) TaxID=717785 RepID=UPI000213EB18|nr:hypothetical protein [Hyphomicrobium sp. MC1]CCB65379.1 protein of unknown function [Hyphomicrobium sp. MC1]